MDYIGSKLKLNKWIFDIIRSTSGNPKRTDFIFDACNGSGQLADVQQDLDIRYCPMI